MDVHGGREPSRRLSQPSGTLPSIRNEGEAQGGEVRRLAERFVHW